MTSVTSTRPGSIVGAGRRASWLMAASAVWSALVVLQLVSLGYNGLLVDGVLVESQWTITWPLVAMGVAAALGSIWSTVLLRRGSPRVRLALALTAALGILGLLTTVAALISLWITRQPARGSRS